MMRRCAVFAAAAVLGGCLWVAGPAAAGGPGGNDNAMTVTMRDYAFVIDGKLRPGQASISVTNQGEEAHILAAYRLKPGVTFKDVKKAINSAGENSDPIAKITNDPEAAYGYPFFLTPGGEATTITNLFRAGNYVMICFLSDAEGKPHFAHGMLQAFKVAGKPVKPRPVESDATVVITDDSITPLPNPAPSDATLKVENQGTTVHSLAIVKLNGDATLPDVEDFYANNYEGGPLPADAPGEIISGVGDIQAGKSVYLAWAGLEPGRYGYASISGSDDSPEGDDFSKGLYGEFTIG
jgi:hypothetical protein